MRIQPQNHRLDEFKYAGSVSTCVEKCDRDATARTALTNKVFQTKEDDYETEGETWTQKTEQENVIDNLER